MHPPFRPPASHPAGSPGTPAGRTDADHPLLQLLRSSSAVSSPSTTSPITSGFPSLGAPASPPTSGTSATGDAQGTADLGLDNLLDSIDRLRVGRYPAGDSWPNNLTNLASPGSRSVSFAGPASGYDPTERTLSDLWENPAAVTAVRDRRNSLGRPRLSSDGAGPLAGGGTPPSPSMLSGPGKRASLLVRLGIDTDPEVRSSGCALTSPLRSPLSVASPWGAPGQPLSSAGELTSPTTATTSGPPRSWGSASLSPLGDACFSPLGGSSENIWAPTAHGPLSPTHPASPAFHRTSLSVSATPTGPSPAPVVPLTITIPPSGPVLGAAQLASLGLNPQDFNPAPPRARYFVIKSNNELDLRRSLQHRIWASTDMGNRRLDRAFRETHFANGDIGGQVTTPIYLFFSVNTSGKFCGVAEMMSEVDMTRKSTVWAQDKWNGVFRVEWIYVKDLANVYLRHIVLTNNGNKPITNSRDTQEVPEPAGRELLRLFHAAPSCSALLESFLLIGDQPLPQPHNPAGHPPPPGPPHHGGGNPYHPSLPHPTSPTHYNSRPPPGTGGGPQVYHLYRGGPAAPPPHGFPPGAGQRPGFASTRRSSESGATLSRPPRYASPAAAAPPSPGYFITSRGIGGAFPSPIHSPPGPPQPRTTTTAAATTTTTTSGMGRPGPPPSQQQQYPRPHGHPHHHHHPQHQHPPHPHHHGAHYRPPPRSSWAPRSHRSASFMNGTSGHPEASIASVLGSGGDTPSGPGYGSYSSPGHNPESR
ncbi:hypothetical protein IWQ60_005711 [Tieghemiomyces parasiticus]|uniref:YTH domain-containing protein n=1 Tax=Tieghemiomyces parasiticus TaxID=78921 RepID=A0A9W8AB92_9FUNG|nr:hypothetical protein IWQ60_005711 [Tieghemiomyces parasiticus]